ncbi:hypothetical protein JW949_02425 [Candidatus Woesearchaeota archaeon]|nr:hypothetical protein [Candidatus Woesearchaeota archaeon]
MRDFLSRLKINKKGLSVPLVLFEVAVGIMVVWGIFFQVIVFKVTDEVNFNNEFQVKDAALLVDTMQSTPYDITINYPFHSSRGEIELTKNSLNLYSQISLWDEINPIASSFYPIVYNSNINLIESRQTAASLAFNKENNMLSMAFYSFLSKEEMFSEIDTSRNLGETSFYISSLDSELDSLTNKIKVFLRNNHGSDMLSKPDNADVIIYFGFNDDDSEDSSLNFYYTPLNEPVKKKFSYIVSGNIDIDFDSIAMERLGKHNAPAYSGFDIMAMETDNLAVYIELGKKENYIEYMTDEENQGKLAENIYNSIKEYFGD